MYEKNKWSMQYKLYERSGAKLSTELSVTLLNYYLNDVVSKIPCFT